jgi:transcriptional antiterminator NusG
MTDEVVLPEDELQPEPAVMDAPDGAEPEAVGRFSLEPEIDEIDDEAEDDLPAPVESRSVPVMELPAPEAEEVKAALRELRATAMRAAASEGAPDLSEAPDDRAWYVVHCYSGYENKVKHNLEQRIESMGMASQIFQVVVPTEEEIEVKEGKRRTVERRVFPGYILVQMLMNDDSWYVVRNTPGVTGFVGMGNKPTPLRTEEVSSIIKRMEAEAPKVKVTFKPGQKVRIVDGPFNDFMGTVDDINMDKAKVRVMVSFFGRETPVELDFLQVEKM